MIKTSAITSERLLKVGVTFQYHCSDSLIYQGECWCIRGRHYKYNEPVGTGYDFLHHIQMGALNRWSEHMEESYGITVDKNKVHPSTVILTEYDCLEDLTKDEKELYEEYELRFGTVTKKWVEEQILHPLITK